MKLVDTDADRPDDEVEPPAKPNPPRPEKRQAATSLILMLSILVGTVVTIYVVFPAPGTDAVGAALRGHRATDPKWQLVAPDDAALEAWALAQLGDHVALPDGVEIVGARPLKLRHRRAALIGYKVGGDAITMLVERGADAGKTRGTRASGDELADAWRAGPWTFVVVGPAASAAAWRPALDVP